MTRKIFSIFDYSQKLAEEFDLELNYPLKPEDLAWKSGKKVWWRCKSSFKGKIQDDHVWQTTPDSRAQNRDINSGEYTSCPFCIGQRPSNAYNLRTEYPQLADEWHSSMNGDLTPEQITPGSTKQIWWQCLRHDSHAWEVSPNQRTGSKNKKTGEKRLSGCIFCEEAGAGRKASFTYNLSKEHPHLDKEWDYEKNGELRPTQFVPHANTKVWWKCLAGRDHPSYRQDISGRSYGRGCPACAKLSLTSSKSETSLAFELSSFLNIEISDHTLNCKNIIFDVDIICRDKKLVVEYDGSFYHDDGESLLRDIRKTSLIEESGWTVIRVREKPLPRISENDVINVRSCDYFRTANKTISQLARLGFINEEDAVNYSKNKKLLKRESLESYVITENLQAAGGQYPKPGRSKTIPEKALSIEQVLGWCDIYYERNNKYPGQYAKSIPEMHGEDFNNINAALNNGNRGLPKMTGIAGLLAQERGYVHNQNKPKIKLDDVINEMINYFRANRKFPTADNKEIAGSLGCKWSALNASLHIGGRGLPKGLSLSKLKKRALEQLNKS